MLDGCGLWLLSDGTLAEVTYEGNWSRWQGSSWGWTATLEVVTARAAMDTWKLPPVLASLEQALAAQLAGNMGKRTKAASERADKLRALVTLAK